jgi:type VI secretion system protein ImpM
VDFFHVSQDGHWVFVGVLTPSRDQSGRRYPLVAGAVLPVEAIDGNAHLAPIAYEVFFEGLREQVTNAVENSVEALACRQFLESHLRAGDSAAADLRLAQGVVERFQATQSVSRLDSLLREAGGGASLSQALLNLAFFQAFLRRFDGAAADQTAVLPLPASKGEEALVASAWLGMQAALWTGGEWGLPWRGSYWVVRMPGKPAILSSAFRRMPKAYAKSVLTGIMDANDILELGREEAAWRNHPLYAEASYALDRLLAEPDLRLAALQGFLRDIGRKLRRDV